MSDYTTTPNYALYKPTVNADVDVWGNHLNANADTLDALLRTIELRSSGGMLLVTDYLDPGQPNGVTDNTGGIQDALDAAAGVVLVGGVPDRAGAPGYLPVMFPAAASPYIISATIYVPSNSRIVIAQGATLQIANGAAADCLHIATNATNVLIEHYGTLDGNAAHAVAPCGGITSSGLCSNIYVQGGNSGLVTNFLNFPININRCTNGEVRGLNITNSGNSPGFAGITSRISIAATGSSYVNATRVLTLSTAPTAHGINVGDTFYYWGSLGAASGLQGEYVALAGTTTTVVVAQTPTALTGDLAITPPGQVGTCVRCYNVGFVDCYVRNIRDIGLCLYSGCTGGYIRNCDVDSGPVIFADAGQPAPCVDSEISGCYTHDGHASGPTVGSAQAFMYHRNTKVFANTVANMARGGIGLSYCDGVDVYGNTLHDNYPVFDGQTGQSGQIQVATGTIRANIHGNDIRNNGQSSTAVPVFLLASPFGTYTSTTGAVSLSTTAAHGLAVGARFYAFNMFGTGNYLALNGWQTATAGTTGTTLNYTAAPGLGTITIASGAVIAFVFAVTSTISSGTYDGPTGNVVLTTAAAHGLVAGRSFVLSGITGAGNFGALLGLQIATAGTTGTTLNFTAVAGLVMTITGGTVMPANFGVSVNSPPYCRIFGNRMGDYQTTINMVAGTGGTCGNRNLIDGNYYGPRLAAGGLFPADACVYAQASVQGINYDTMLGGAVSGTLAAQNLAGITNFPGQGLTIGWNINSGFGNIGFLCGRGLGTTGGFDIKQVAAIGTVDSSVGLAGSLLANDGFGNTRLGGALVHGSLQTGGVLPPQIITTGQTVTIPNNASFVMVRSSGSLAAATVALPTIPNVSGTYQLVGSELEINFQNQVGTLTLTGVMEGPVPTSIATAHTSLNFVWGGTSWVRRIMT